MPVTWEKTDKDFSILVWKSTESIEELFNKAALSVEEKARWESFRSETRKREYLTVRNALKFFPGHHTLAGIRYDGNGKPLLANGCLSISHSNEFVAVMLAPSVRIGIDIETIHPRIEKLSKRFLNRDEKKFLPVKNHLEHLHVIWGAKEVLFKIHSAGGIDFRQHLHVDPFRFHGSGSLHAHMTAGQRTETFDIHYEQIGGQMLTWAADSNHISG